MTPATTSFAREWARAVAAVPHGPVPVEESLLVLTRLTDRLAGALTAPDLHPATGREVGAALVGVGLVSPDALGRTLQCLCGLPDAVHGASHDDASRDMVRRRMPALLGAVAAGHAAALQAFAQEDRQELIDRESLRRELIERALADSESRLQAVLRALDQAVLLCTTEARVLEANPVFLRLVRHRAGYVRGRTLGELVQAEDAAALDDLVPPGRLHAGTRHRARLRFRRRSGGGAWLDVAAELVPGRPGGRDHLVVVGEPVTAPAATEPVTGTRSWAFRERREGRARPGTVLTAGA